uniref:Uncharacterized protein n=2 Tax=Mycolicibacterium TaxID=1866885 RepID=A0A343VQY3_9MYCO|nr:hypothetical protein [Mycolicibacterium sp. CBMA 213]AVN58307.1 hypothetical protein B5P44_p00012 [Mycolicibacterium sp. CBMA 213]
MGYFRLATNETAPWDWELPRSSGGATTYALGLLTENGDGTVLHGEAHEVLAYVDRLHAHVHQQLDAVSQR